MPIANPFQEPEPEDRPDGASGAEGASGGAPASFGKPERRPGERDRTRTRTRKENGNTRRAAHTPPHGDGQGPARDDTPADAPTAAEGPSAAEEQSGGAVLPFPSGQVVAEPDGDGPASTALAGAAQVWWAEASATARQALDGSVWRARPPALRDSAVRLQRAEWSGGLPALRWAGWIYGYPALAVRAALMGLLWLLDHPTRLLVLAGVIAAALIF